ncbi:MAG: hypothetical protein JXR19_10715 [Bacteroidia bacterium]
MNKLSLTKQNTEVWLLAAATLVITLFLFFIDEGYYNFHWMRSVGNWIAFLIYFTLIFFFQLLISQVVLRNFHGKGKAVISIVLGTTIALLLAIGVIFS